MTAIVLGSGVYRDGSLPSQSAAALRYVRRYFPDYRVILSGGQHGQMPTSEAEAMYHYLTALNFPAEQILLENKAASTFGNLLRSRLLLEEREEYAASRPLAIIGTYYHWPLRVKLLARKIFGHGNFRVYSDGFALSKLPREIASCCLWWHSLSPYTPESIKDALFLDQFRYPVAPAPPTGLPAPRIVP